LQTPSWHVTRCVRSLKTLCHKIIYILISSNFFGRPIYYQFNVGKSKMNLPYLVIFPRPPGMRRKSVVQSSSPRPAGGLAEFRLLLFRKRTLLSLGCSYLEKKVSFDPKSIFLNCRVATHFWFAQTFVLYL